MVILIDMGLLYLFGIRIINDGIFLLIIVEEKTQSNIGCLGYINVTAIILFYFERTHIVLRTISNPNCTYRYLRSAATRTSYTSSSDSIITLQGIASPFDHSFCHSLTHSSLFFYQFGIDMKQTFLDVIAV